MPKSTITLQSSFALLENHDNADGIPITITDNENGSPKDYWLTEDVGAMKEIGRVTLATKEDFQTVQKKKTKKRTLRTCAMSHVSKPPRTAEAEKAASAACGNLSVEAKTNESATRRTWSCGTGEGQKSQGQITTCRPEETTCRPEMTNGGVVQAQGFIGPRFYNGAGLGVTHPTGPGGFLHDPHPSLYSALPGGKCRGREIMEAKDPAKAGKP